MGYPENIDPRTGKAPNHQAAAEKGKKGKSKWVDWRNKDVQYLRKIANGYNPLQVEMKNKWYELKRIAFYDSNGIVIETVGWFGSNNNLDSFPIPETIRRLKPKFDGETFIMPKKKEWHERSDPNPYAILYIPIDYFNFDIKEVVEDYGSGQKIKKRYYVSKSFDQDYSGNPLTLKEWIGQPYYTKKGEELMEEIADLEKQIKDKKTKLRKL